MADTFDLTPEEVVADFNATIPLVLPDVYAASPYPFPSYQASGEKMCVIPDMLYLTLFEGEDGRLSEARVQWTFQAYTGPVWSYVGFILGTLFALLTGELADERMSDLLSQRSLSKRSSILLYRQVTLHHQYSEAEGFQWNFTHNRA